jgi:hypothetical protein
LMSTSFTEYKDIKKNLTKKKQEYIRIKWNEWKNKKKKKKPISIWPVRVSSRSYSTISLTNTQQPNM